MDGDETVVVEEVLGLAVLRAIDAVDVAALEFVKTRLIVSMGLKKLEGDVGAGAGVDAFASFALYGGG
jgi:hypothetical protein